MFDDDTNRSYISRDQMRQILLAMDVAKGRHQPITEISKRRIEDELNTIMLETDPECDVQTSVDFEDFADVLARRGSTPKAAGLKEQIVALKKKLDNGESIVAETDHGVAGHEQRAPGSPPPREDPILQRLKSNACFAGRETEETKMLIARRGSRAGSSLLGPAPAAAAASGEEADKNATGGGNPGSGNNNSAPPTAQQQQQQHNQQHYTYHTSAVGAAGDSGKREPPQPAPRYLSGKDHIRIARRDFDEAFAWITSRCAKEGRITDRGLKDQLHSVFGSNLRWTRKELLVLAHDPDMTADKLWNLLAQEPVCAAFDTVAEVFGMFDRDGDGVVDDEVLRAMWVELFKEKPMAEKLPDSHDKVIDAKVKEMYIGIADADGDDLVNLEDFRKYAKKQKGIMD